MTNRAVNRGLCAVACFMVLGSSGTTLAATTTDPTGGGQPFNTQQPTLGLHFAVHERGSLGEIRIFPYASLPQQWLTASGQLLPVAGNTPLAMELGNAFGGDGMTDFALPNLNGRLAVGAGMGFGLTSRSRGEQFGSDVISLLEDQMPIHDHGLSGGGVTEAAGGGMPHSTMQSSLGLRFGINTAGIFPNVADPTAGTPNNPFLGQVRFFAGASALANVHDADGESLFIAQNTALFSLLGTTYGGNGQTTFGLPDLRGRTPIGQGQGPELNDRVLGEQPGAESITLTTAQMPLHSHTIPDAKGGGVTDPSGGGQPADNMQPSLTMNFLIRLQGVVPNPQTAFDSNAPYLGEIIMAGYNFAPNGWAACEGQFLSIAQNPDLFGLLGTTFGGDGMNTFRLPDLRGRGILGSNGFDRAVGDTLGTEGITLGVDNLPSHVHVIPSPAAIATALIAIGTGLRRRR